MMKGLEHLSYGKDCQALTQLAQGGWGISLLGGVLRSHLNMVVGKKL